MIAQLDEVSRNFWDRRWGRLLRHHGMIAPSGKLIQLMIPYIDRGGLVLDLGCGEGRNTIYLNRIGYYGIGLDLSFKGVKVLTNNLFEEEVKGAGLMGDARCLAFRHNTFHGILAHNLMDHLSQKSLAASMSEAFRVLKPRGILLMTFDPCPAKFSDRQGTIKDDGTIVFTAGQNKGLVLRPFNRADFQDAVAHGWEILKEDQTPREARIILLRKTDTSS
jgi:SAM-dependent methyltransferase